MKKTVSLLMLLALCGPPVFAGEDEAREQKEPGAPTYESPLLSLLFLPVNLLIKAASVFEPRSSSSSSTSSGRAPASGNGK